MPLWPFRSRSVLDRDEEEWQLETWLWLVERLGGTRALRNVPLVMPTPRFFPPTDLEGHARAEHIFAAVKRHAGMSEWHCRLVAQPERPQARVGEWWVLKPEKPMPLGTFGTDGNEVVITYDPQMLRDPMALIATFAHELAHYLLAGLSELPPGGKDLVELATDVTSVFLGFGIFGANSAFTFHQHHDFMTQGWSSSRQGYLGEAAWAFGLAVFMALREESLDLVRPHVKRSVWKQARRSGRYLTRRPALLVAHRNAKALPALAAAG
jgi:hypothetical protein